MDENIKLIEKWSDIGAYVSGRGKIKAVCPACKDMRSNKKDKALSINVADGVGFCHYCNTKYVIKTAKENASYMAPQKKEYRRPKWNNKTELSDKLVKWFETRCISQATLKAMRISEGLEYMPQKQKQCNTAQFNYFCNGQLVNVKYRTGDKCFKMVSGAELILYNIDSTIGEKDIIITEGEIDCLSFIECGFKSVVSVPNGANSTEYLDNYIEEYFDDKETIYIAADSDKKGFMLREELIRRFGVERCKIVEYGPECKDANEHLVKYGKESLKITIGNASDIKIEGVFELYDASEQVYTLFDKGMPSGLKTGHYRFDNLIRWETGRLAVVTGIPGHGKSEFVDEISTLLNVKHGWKFAYFSPENHPLAYLISKLVSKITGKKFDKDILPKSEFNKACDHINDNFFFICPEEDFTLKSIIDKAKYLVKKKGIKGLVIDPYNTIETQIPPGMSETNYISQVLGELTTFARKHDVLTFLVAHPRKLQKKGDIMESPNLYDISGSANFYNKADYGLTVFRDRANSIVRVEVHKVKFKNLGEIGSVNFKYNFANGRYVECNGEVESRINWNNDSYLFTEDVQNEIDFYDSRIVNNEDFLRTADESELPF